MPARKRESIRACAFATMKDWELERERSKIEFELKIWDQFFTRYNNRQFKLTKYKLEQAQWNREHLLRYKAEVDELMEKKKGIVSN